MLPSSAATPFIGTPRRWLAPVGVADLDGDGRAEIAYVETPHRDKVLMLENGQISRIVPVVVQTTPSTQSPQASA